MSSVWEVASDVTGFVSAFLLLFPAFGSNKISKRLTELRDRIEKLRKTKTSEGTLAQEALDRSKENTERWTAKDERLLRAAAMLLVLSFALKGIHHIWPAKCAPEDACASSVKPIGEKRN